MLVQIQGVIRGKQIELERETGLPSGSTVVVRIEPKRVPLEERRRLVDMLCGAWANDTSLKSIFEEIEQLRTIALPREVNFHAAFLP